jgi:hypothetical protein
MTSRLFRNNTKVENQNYTFGQEFLAQVLDWVTSNFTPNEIYEDPQLKDTCSTEYKVDEVYDNEQILNYVQQELLANRLSAEDVVPVKDLQHWAEDNGYIKEK